MKKLRILCLHGYHGNATILKNQMRSLADNLDSLAEFVYVDAPSLATGDFGWWHAVKSENSAEKGNPGVGPAMVHYKGWERTRDWIIDFFEKNGPFDGIFGFSQGAALAALLVSLRAPNGKTTASKPLSFYFAIVVSGFLAADAVLAKGYESKDSYDLPSVHIIGRSDSIVPSEYSHRVASRFNAPLILEHNGGHVVASTPDIKQQVSIFLEDMIARKNTMHASASQPQFHPQSLEVALWPHRPHPAMKVIFPKTPSSSPRPAMLVFRGGGYSYDKGSGGGSAEWAAQHGMIGIEVEYGTRDTNSYYPDNYADAARAVRLVRHHAAEWGIHPQRIGVMGYSAGGHLVSLLSTQPNVWKSPHDDLAHSLSAKPDLIVLGYPLISFVDHYAPGAFVGSVENFFGQNTISETRRREFSNELHVNAEHPPVFIWTTKDDSLVPYTHSHLFAEACRNAGIPVEFKLYSHGAHGMGLALNQTSDVRQWTTLLLNWLIHQWGPLN